MKNIMFLFLLSIVFCSCLKNIDDVELNTNPFDQDYDTPLILVENIRVKDVSNPGGDPRCAIVVDFQVDETSLNRVKSLTNINDENVKIVIRYRVIYNSTSQSNPVEMERIDLDLIEPNKTYSGDSPSFLTLCGKEVCIEVLYEDIKTGSPGGTPEERSEKEGAVQKVDCFVVSL
jgi:hypothetical protein